jgi:RNase P subunit RPR2
VTPPSYTGPEVVCVCLECGDKVNAPDPDAFGTDPDKRLWCPACRAVTPRDYWSGPLEVV